jgi:hypothetical protein
MLTTTAAKIKAVPRGLAFGTVCRAAVEVKTRRDRRDEPLARPAG